MNKSGEIVEAGNQDRELRMDQFPSIDMFLYRPLLAEPPMCSLKELQDGTYSIYDLALMHQIMDFKVYVKQGE